MLIPLLIYVILIRFTSGLTPRSTNPTSDPMGSYRIRWSDRILQDSWWRNCIGFRRPNVKCYKFYERSF